MTAKLLLRIAAALMLLHTIGHSIGAFTWKQAPNAAVAQTIAGMINNHFDFMSRSASLGSFFDGYGIMNIFVLLLIALVLWLLSSDTTSSLTRKLVMVFGIFLLLMGVTEYIYFFAFAAIISLLAGVCTLTALLKKS